ncbi:MAG: HIT family protein [Candidatus Ancaeobacter aquaticus]|nr:HIT family protein [Candidatus Ancaeobacter aquaticus]
MDCIFCKIVNGEVPSVKIYEDAHVVAFMDIMPAKKGHVLVIPKKHCETILDISKEDLSLLMQCVQTCARAVFKGVHAEGLNILQYNGSVSGQIVNHLHFHIIPRSERDGLRIGWDHEIYQADEIDVYAKKIRDEIA